eukprot:835150-Prymnesium_polylepis.1
MANDPTWMHSVLALLSSRAQASVVESLPMRSFHMLLQYELAFRLLQSGLNTGKVVLYNADY